MDRDAQLPACGGRLASAASLIVPRAMWLVLAFAALPASAQDIPTAKVTAPAGHTVFQQELGGAYVVPKALRDTYEALSARVRNLKADILEARIDEDEAKKEIAALQKKIRETLEQIDKAEIRVPIGTLHERTDTQEFELGAAGCLFVTAGKVRIVGSGEPRVKAVLQKRVLTVRADDDSVAADFEGIRAEHQRVPAAEALGLPSVEYVAKLTPEKLAQHSKLGPSFLLKYRAVARANAEKLAKLNPEIAEILSRKERPLGEQSLIQRLDFEPLAELGDQEIDVVKLTGLTYEEGNRQLLYEVASEGGGALHGSEWRRHATLTLFVPACTMVAVRGALEGLVVESLDAALEVVGSDSRDYQATYEIRDLRGPLTVKGIPLQSLQNVRGNATVVLTEYVENAGTEHAGDSRTHWNADPGQYTYKSIQGDFRAWFCRANLQLEGVAGKVDVRNDFGNTVLACSRKLADAPHRVVSESGHIEVKLAADALGELPVTALSECGRVQVSGSMPSLDSFMFSTSEGSNGIQRSWGGFVTKTGAAPDQADPFARFRRPAAALQDLDRSPGLDLISRAGSVRIQTAE